MSTVSALQDAIDKAQSAASIQCINVAACTLWICDYCHTLEAEVLLVWRRRWAVGKILFLLLRHGTTGYLIFSIYDGAVDWDTRSAHARFGMEVIDNVGALVLPFFELGVFMLGIYGLLGATRNWKVLLVIVYLMSAAISSTLMANHLAARVRGQSEANVFRIIGNYWVFVRHISIFSLSSYALYRRYHNYNRQLDRSSRRSLISTLRQDSLVYYVGISATTLWACIFYTPGFPRHIREVAYSGSLNRAVGSLLATRLFINLGRKFETEGTDLENVSTIRFASYQQTMTQTPERVAPADSCGRSTPGTVQ